MTINVREQKATESIHVVDMTVEQTGLDVTVKAGSFKVGGQDYTLVEDSVYTAQNVAERVYVNAYLVWDTVQEEVSVMVEEMPDSDPEAYEWNGSPYENLHCVYNIVIPASTSSLDAIDIDVHKTIPAPSSQEGGEE